MTEPGRNELCWCGSRKKYKRCHLDADRQSTLVTLGPGVTARVRLRRATLVDREAPRLAQWYVKLARQLTAQATAPEANTAHTLVALLMVVTAGEAVVNRLLEPMVNQYEWAELERRPHTAKWCRLSELLALNPRFRLGSRPLQRFAQLVRLRDDLVHFKHGANTYSSTEELEVRHLGGRAVVGGPTAKREKRPKRDFHAELEPTRAPDHLGALIDVLEPVLAKYPNDEFDIVGELRSAMDEPLT